MRRTARTRPTLTTMPPRSRPPWGWMTTRTTGWMIATRRRRRRRRRGGREKRRRRVGGRGRGRGTGWTETGRGRKRTASKQATPPSPLPPPPLTDAEQSDARAVVDSEGNTSRIFVPWAEVQIVETQFAPPEQAVVVRGGEGRKGRGEGVGGGGGRGVGRSSHLLHFLEMRQKRMKEERLAAKERPRSGSFVVPALPLLSSSVSAAPPFLPASPRPGRHRQRAHHHLPRAHSRRWQLGCGHPLLAAVDRLHAAARHRVVQSGARLPVRSLPPHCSPLLPPHPHPPFLLLLFPLLSPPDLPPSPSPPSSSSTTSSCAAP